jgi:hypothetical protein
VAGSECLLDGEKKGDRRDEGCCCFASCVMHQQKGKAAAWIWWMEDRKGVLAVLGCFNGGRMQLLAK